MNDNPTPSAAPQQSSGPVLQPVITRRDDTAGGSHLNNVQSHYFLRGEQTGQAFSLTEIVFQPGSPGTPLHVHHREEETYYVIEGQLEAHIGDEKVVLEAGGSVLLPRGLRHKVFPVGDKVTRVLMTISPPGLENMLAQLDQLGRVGKLDMDAIIRLSVDYGVEILSE